MSLDLPPNATPEREQAILDYVRAGSYEAPWAVVTSDIEGHHGEFQVFGDALKIENVRVNVTAETEQLIADELGCLLLTPKLADLIWIQRDCTIKPFPRSITSTTQGMIDHSADIDKAIAQLTAQPTLIASTGKHWLIDNDMLAHPGMAENYGWHYQGHDWTGGHEFAVSKDPSGQLITMIQGRGWRHNKGHVDYSQICVLVSRDCTIDGNTMDLLDVLKDPALAALANHSGVMKVFRQPGV